MDYSTFSTACLEKIMGRVKEQGSHAGTSPSEDEEIQAELERRQSRTAATEDTQTMKLFTAEEMARARRH